MNTESSQGHTHHFAKFSVVITNPSPLQYSITLTNPCVVKGQNFCVPSGAVGSGNYSVAWNLATDPNLPFDGIRFIFTLATPGYTFVTPYFTSNPAPNSTGLTFGTPTVSPKGTQMNVLASLTSPATGTYAYSLSIADPSGVPFSIDPDGDVDISVNSA